VDAVLFTAEEPLYLPRYLEPVLDAHADAFEEVVIAPPSTGTATELRRQFRLFGPATFLRMAARFARGTLLDALPLGLGRRLTGRYHGVATLASSYGIPVRRVSDVSAPSFVHALEARDPDVVLSVVCGQRLPPAALDVPDVALNLHGSLLPKYRGRAVAFWPLYYGDDETGVTAHVMTDEFDAGPIVEQGAFEIGAADTMHDVSLKLAEVGSELAIDLLDLLPGDLETRSNPTGPDDYHTLPTPEERREFRRRGNRFV
jgi:folate-dependent phosphoribosylglycinamide formyltransferase PurN